MPIVLFPNFLPHTTNPRPVFQQTDYVGRRNKYLHTYLKLEQVRFENSFEYDISVDEHLQPEQVYLPSLLLQPFVENSIRHGIRNQKIRMVRSRLCFMPKGNM